MDFLDAPNRILDFLENDAFQYFLKQKETGRLGRMGLQFLDSAQGAINLFLSKFAGTEFITDLSDFLFMMRDLYPPIIRRTRAFQRLLASEQTQFLVVTQPSPQALKEATFFLDELKKRQLSCGGLVMNRVLQLDPVLQNFESNVATYQHQATEILGVAPSQWDKITTAFFAHRDRTNFHHAQITQVHQRLPDGCSQFSIPDLQKDLSNAQGLRSLLSVYGFVETET